MQRSAYLTELSRTILEEARNGSPEGRVKISIPYSVLLRERYPYLPLEVRGSWDTVKFDIQVGKHGYTIRVSVPLDVRGDLPVVTMLDRIIRLKASSEDAMLASIPLTKKIKALAKHGIVTILSHMNGSVRLVLPAQASNLAGELITVATELAMREENSGRLHLSKVRLRRNSIMIVGDGLTVSLGVRSVRRATYTMVLMELALSARRNKILEEVFENTVRLILEIFERAADELLSELPSGE